jgi:hypothetical protein
VRLIWAVAFFGMLFMGILFGGVHLSDPIYRFRARQLFLKKNEHLEQTGVQREVLSTFLASSLNVELVYLVLTGITKFSKSDKGSIQKDTRITRVKTKGKNLKEGPLCELANQSN